MIKFVVGRTLMIIPILLGVTFIVFTILYLTPGDPGRMILGPQAEQIAVDMLNEEMGFNDPFFTRFFAYVINVVTRFDFGTSFRTRQPVFDEILIRFPYTLRLATAAVVVASFIGIPIGVLSAVKQYSLADLIPRAISMFLAAVPLFWLGLMLILTFALTLGWLPSSGVATWRHYILPVTTSALPTAAGLMRMTRSTMLETIRQDYIRTARAKGAPEGRVIFKHALKNALLPVVTVLGGSFGFLLGGAIVTETVFAMPGLGTMMVNAIRMQDIPMVLAATIFIATICCLVILMVDLAYGFIDPRIRAKFLK
ncbi:MAG: ABC transporter permease [Defluviitaleaceae bacterium]|nr:ABC transporter permease [Defluviitaleaceae bacterium]